MIWTVISAYIDVTTMFWGWFVNYWIDIGAVGTVLSVCGVVARIFSQRNVTTTRSQDEDTWGWLGVSLVVSWALPVFATILFWLTMALVPATLTVALVKLYELATHKEPLPEAKVVNGDRL